MSEIWEPANRIEERYRHDLQRINDLIFSSIAGLTDPFEITFILNQIGAGAEFKRIAHNAARRMVTGKLMENQKTWRKAAARSTQAKRIYEALRKELSGPVGQAVWAQIAENARLITNMPLEYKRNITAMVAEQAFAGKRSIVMAGEIMQMFPEMSANRARLIARTETSKTTTALSQARAEELGAGWYVWRTSEDQRVRSSHAHMEGVLCRWTEPPAPEVLIGERSVGRYPPGGIWNCRCFPQVFLSMKDVQWPCKVHYNGTIQRMTQSRFLAIQ